MSAAMQRLWCSFNCIKAIGIIETNDWNSDIPSFFCIYTAPANYFHK